MRLKDRRQSKDETILAVRSKNFRKYIEVSRVWPTNELAPLFYKHFSFAHPTIFFEATLVQIFILLSDFEKKVTVDHSVDILVTSVLDKTRDYLSMGKLEKDETQHAE